MCVYTYVCVCACIHACVCVPVCVHLCVCTYVCVHLCVCACVHARVRALCDDIDVSAMAELSQSLSQDLESQFPVSVREGG